MAKITTYSIRFDGRSKELILLGLANLQQQLEQQVAQGGDEATLQTYDQVGQVRRGILLAPPEEVETEDLEANNSETIDESPEEMYKSQEGRQS